MVVCTCACFCLYVGWGSFTGVILFDSLIMGGVGGGICIRMLKFLILF